jgi:hypothetical protein
MFDYRQEGEEVGEGAEDTGQAVAITEKKKEVRPRSYSLRPQGSCGYKPISLPPHTLQEMHASSLDP